MKLCPSRAAIRLRSTSSLARARFSSLPQSAKSVIFFNPIAPRTYSSAPSTITALNKNSGLHDFVVMPDHFHVLLTLDHSTTIEKAVQFIKGGFAYRAARELNFIPPVWQKGFSEVRIQDLNAFVQISDYIRNNPVARHLVIEAAQYPYSSAYPGYNLDPVPPGLKPVPGPPSTGMAKAMP